MSDSMRNPLVKTFHEMEKERRRQSQINEISKQEVERKEKESERIRLRERAEAEVARQTALSIEQELKYKGGASSPSSAVSPSAPSIIVKRISENTTIEEIARLEALQKLEQQKQRRSTMVTQKRLPSKRPQLPSSTIKVTQTSGRENNKPVEQDLPDPPVSQLRPVNKAPLSKPVKPRPKVARSNTDNEAESQTDTTCNNSAPPLQEVVVVSSSLPEVESVTAASSVEFTSVEEPAAAESQQQFTNIYMPLGWVSMVDEATAKVYYYNSELHLTQWERPPLPDGWQEHVDEEGLLYYYNRELGQTCWPEELKWIVLIRLLQSDALLMSRSVSENAGASAGSQPSSQDAGEAEGMVVAPEYAISKVEAADLRRVSRSIALTSYKVAVEKIFNEIFSVAVVVCSSEFQLDSGSSTASTEANVLFALNVGNFVASSFPLVSSILSVASGTVEAIGTAKKIGKFSKINALNSTGSTAEAARWSRRLAVALALKFESMIEDRHACSTINVESSDNSSLEAVKSSLRGSMARVAGQAVTLGVFGSDIKQSAVEQLASRHAQEAIRYIMSDLWVSGENEEDSVEKIAAHIEIFESKLVDSVAVAVSSVESDGSSGAPLSPIPPTSPISRPSGCCVVM